MNLNRRNAILATGAALVTGALGGDVMAASCATIPKEPVACFAVEMGSPEFFKAVLREAMDLYKLEGSEEDVDNAANNMVAIYRHNLDLVKDDVESIKSLNNSMTILAFALVYNATWAIKEGRPIGKVFEKFRLAA